VNSNEEIWCVPLKSLLVVNAGTVSERIRPMNNHELVSAIQYLLESRQSELLAKLTRPYKQQELRDEISEIENFVEMTRKGYVK